VHRDKIAKPVSSQSLLPARGRAAGKSPATTRRRPAAAALDVFDRHPENGRSEFRLDRHIPYLLNYAGGQLSVTFGAALHGTKIRYRMWRVLHTLWHLGPLTLMEISMLAVFDISTLSRVADDLERKKLIFRVKNPQQRAPRLDLTDKGAELVERLLPAAQSSEDAALQGFSAKDKAALVRMLRRIAANIGTL
jgi:DNA-binding MarR family transcriptional regulator